MNKDEKLAEQINTYAQLAQENKNIDAAVLMMNAVQNQNRNMVSARAKKWAYLISIGAPPFGLLFALKYYFSSEDDARTVAYICVILTVVSLLGLWLFGKLFFSGSGSSLEQIQQIKPEDLQGLY